MKTNPLPVQVLFATPSDSQVLWNWIENLSGSERTVAMTAAGMTWNLASRIVQEKIDQVD